jgi:hypothetical protein
MTLLRRAPLRALLPVTLLAACGPAGDASRSLAEPAPTSPFETSFKCDDTSPAYVAAVRSGDYQGAVRLVCQAFSLPCDGHSFDPDMSLTTDIAYTNALTDQITLGVKAFTYEYCDKPHDGWLAAVVGHEILHTTQSRWDRYWAAKLGLTAATARLELPAWQYMWDRRDQFHLTTRMRIDIDSQISAYEADLK